MITLLLTLINLIGYYYLVFWISTKLYNKVDPNETKDWLGWTIFISTMFILWIPMILFPICFFIIPILNIIILIYMSGNDRRERESQQRIEEYMKRYKEENPPYDV